MTSSGAPGGVAADPGHGIGLAQGEVAQIGHQRGNVLGAGDLFAGQHQQAVGPQEPLEAGNGLWQGMLRHWATASRMADPAMERRPRQLAGSAESGQAAG